MPPLPPAGVPATLLGSILDVEASHLALSKTENMSDRLVFKPVRLPVCTENSNSDIMVMQSTENRVGVDTAGSLNWA